MLCLKIEPSLPQDSSSGHKTTEGTLEPNFKKEVERFSCQHGHFQLSGSPLFDSKFLFFSSLKYRHHVTIALGVIVKKFRVERFLFQESCCRTGCGGTQTVMPKHSSLGLYTGLRKTYMHKLVRTKT